ncbi:MAG: rane bound O-acyl transferase family protein [Gemmatimonadetes bacterium]|nr:rane bound O-acyl transferase family protein [Gemmatimonadota bacterium]
MLFNSVSFLLFFPLVTGIYFLSPQRLRTPVVLLASCAFYMAFVPVYILILGFTIIVDFAAGIWIEERTGAARKVALVASLVANIGVLAVFKYYGFATGNVSTLAALLGRQVAFPPLAILLPIGLSFHTFQAMSYTIEVYRRRQRAERDFLTYALYVMFYPQLVAGPIERPQNLLHQFRDTHEFNYARVVAGLRRMAIGMFKKVVVADTIAVQVDAVYDHLAGQTGLPLVVATVLFAFQIYYDFSGYSDIALGSAQVMGFDLMENFRTPYFSRSVGEFWRRWHISLSTWFKDYLYIPLGGSRGTWARRATNIMIVFLVSGLWHGASWAFVVWGALHGTYLVVGSATASLRARMRDRSPLGPAAQRVLSTLCTFALVDLAWVFFRARTVSDGWYVLSRMPVGLAGDLGRFLSGSPVYGLVRSSLAAAVLLLVAVTLVERQAIEKRGVREGTLIARFPAPLRLAAYAILIYACVLVGAGGARQQFIYFQF